MSFRLVYTVQDTADLLLTKPPVTPKEFHIAPYPLSKLIVSARAPLHFVVRAGGSDEWQPTCVFWRQKVIATSSTWTQFLRCSACQWHGSRGDCQWISPTKQQQQQNNNLANTILKTNDYRAQFKMVTRRHTIRRGGRETAAHLWHPTTLRTFFFLLVCAVISTALY